jgi:hypothetical protein
MEETKDIIGEKLTANENTAETIDQEIKEVIENDPDVMKLKAQEAELMNLISDPKVMKAYRAIRRDIYGVSERRQVSKKEKKKKKAKRRMAKKSKK